MTLLAPERVAELAEDANREYLHLLWLSAQCPICEEGGSGLECDAHVVELETQMKRWLDA